jgi:hypothetical protein
VREPAFNIVGTLASFKPSSRYKEISTLSTNPMTIAIDKEKTRTLSFYQSVNYIKAKKTKILGKITLEVKADQVQMDVFAEHNYISSQVMLEIRGIDSFVDYGTVEFEDEHFNSNSIYTARNAIRTIGTGNVFIKGTYVLFIKTDSYSKSLFQAMEENNVKLSDDLLIPFTIKIESTPVKEDLKTTDEKLRLIDIEINGDPDDDGKSVNNEENLSITLEFNDNLDNTDLLDGGEESSFAVLALDKKYHKSVKKNFRNVTADSVDRLSVMSENMIQLVFSAKSLKKNAEYHLILDPRIGINQDILENDLLTIKTLSSKCNPMGVNKQKESSDGICNCKYPYMGSTCHQCQDEYQFNSETNECFLFETCLEDTCNGHGQCYVNKKNGRAQ